MVLDIQLVRENPEIVKDSQKRRFAPVEAVDKVLELDAAWRKLRFDLDQAKKEIGKTQKEIGQIMKNKGDASAQLATKAKIAETIAELEKKESQAKKATDEELSKLGNIVHPSVPVSNDEAENGIYVMHGEAVKNEKGYHHHELLAMIDGYDQDRGTKVAGHRAYFLRGWGVKLNQALINYGLNFLDQRGYVPTQTPYFMKKSLMGKTCQLSDFEESLYKIAPDPSMDPDDCKEEEVMIATSEQPISAFYSGEWLFPKDLPVKFAGYSTNFRKEAGAHGKDTWGIFRVHQFEKIEQFVITEPDKSWEMHEQMLKVSEEFYQSLGFSYRVVNIVSGALNNAAAKKYDLEAWFPVRGEYKELVSCSNCTDYQSRGLEVYYGVKKDKKTPFVHMLNSTLVATERCLCCLLENCQTEKGITVPEVLRPYLGGVDFIPFTKPCPKRTAEKKK